MSLVSIASQGGAPGTTTASLVMAGLWPKPKRSKLFVEADPSGGSLATRYQLNLDPDLGTLARDVSSGVASKRLWRNSQLLPGSIEAVIGPVSSADSSKVLERHGSQLGTWLDNLRKVDVLADVGNLASSSSSQSFVACSSVLVMVGRPDLENLASGAETMRSFEGIVPNLGWLLMGDQPFGVKEIEAAFNFPVFGVLPDDQKGATALEQGSSVLHLSNSPLIKSASEVVDKVQKVLAGSHPLRTTQVSRPVSIGQNETPLKHAEAIVPTRPPSLVRDRDGNFACNPVSTNESSVVGGLAFVMSQGDHDQPSRSTDVAKLDLNATTQVEAISVDLTPVSSGTPRRSSTPAPLTSPPSQTEDETSLQSSFGPVSASRFWESTTKLTVPASQLSAMQSKTKSPVGSIDNGAAGTVSVPPESGHEIPERGKSVSEAPEQQKAMVGVSDLSASTKLKRDMSITEMIENVETPTGNIDVPPSLVSEKAIENREVPPSFFQDISPDEEVDQTSGPRPQNDKIDPLGTGVRPPSLLDAKLSTSANSAGELPGYPSIR